IGKPETGPFVVSTLHNTLDTAFGVFGWGHLPLPEPIQQLWVVGFALACAGLVIRLIKGQRRRQIAILLALLAGLLISGLALALFYQLVYWLPGRCLLPGLRAASLLIVLGGAAFRARGLSTVFTWTVIVAVIVLNLWMPGHFLAPLYVPPPAV